MAGCGGDAPSAGPSASASTVPPSLASPTPDVIIDDARTHRHTDLGTLGGARSQARAVNGRDESWASSINNQGLAAGSTSVASGGPHAFVWQDGKLTDLGTLGGPRVARIVTINVPGLR